MFLKDTHFMICSWTFPCGLSIYYFIQFFPYVFSSSLSIQSFHIVFPSGISICFFRESLFIKALFIHSLPQLKTQQDIRETEVQNKSPNIADSSVEHKSKYSGQQCRTKVQIQRTVVQNTSPNIADSSPHRIYVHHRH